MSTCKDCLHYEVCGGFTPTDLDADVFDYCRKGNTDEIPDIDERCGNFKPKADYVEVKHGYWKQTKEPLGVHDVNCIECSVCGESWILDEDWSFEEHTEYCHYCINCGAKMDGERKESEVRE